MLNLDATPGQIFVIAAILPLLGCLALLVAALVRAVLAPYAAKSKHVETVYKLFGGDQPAFGAGAIGCIACGMAMLFGLLGLGIYFDRSMVHDEKERVVRQEIAWLESRLAVAGPTRLATLRKDLVAARSKLDLETTAYRHQFHASAAWLRVLPASADAAHGTTIPLGFKIDGLSAALFLLITVVFLMVNIYAMVYLAEETEQIEDTQVQMEFGGLWRRGRFSRFYLYLGLLTFAMLHLVIADNLVQAMVSWQLVGFCTYRLVGFWYERSATNAVALQTFLLHRVGDGVFLVGVFILWTAVGTVGYDELDRRLRAPLQDRDGLVTPGGQFVYLQPSPEPGLVRLADAATGDRVMLLPQSLPKPDLDYRDRGSIGTWLLALAGLCLVVGCLVKAAQVPVQAWLHEAQVGPLPVLALLQTATTIAAGVYLLARVYPILTPGVLTLLAYVGLVGLLFGAIVALFLVDLRSVLVFTTISQVGLMLLGLGVGAWTGGVFHLLTHAFFMGVLILAAGCVLFVTKGEGDVRKLGGLALRMPLTATMALLATLTIAGMPFLSAWYSRGAIVDQAFGLVLVNAWHLPLFLGTLAASGLTAFTLFRLWILTFQGLPREAKPFLAADEAPSAMSFTLLVLGFLTATSAWGLSPWDRHGSWVESLLHRAQPTSVQSDFGTVPERGEVWLGGAIKSPATSERLLAVHYGIWSMLLTLLASGVGVYFAYAWYAPTEPITEEGLRAVLGAEPTAHPEDPLVSRPRIWYEDEVEPEPVPEPVAPTPTEPVPEPAKARPPIADPGPLALLLARGIDLGTLATTLIVKPARWLSTGLTWVDAVLLESAGRKLAAGIVAVARLGGHLDRRLNAAVDGAGAIFGHLAGWFRAAQAGSVWVNLLVLILAAVGLFLVVSVLAR